jgi:LPPG:FO 2-phospho-L-lactate transferase
MSAPGSQGDATRVLALSGGIGGAKLALGLYQVLSPDALTVVCNTGDDFTHLGLRISPDLDTVLYTLAGLANRELGWGREGETWTFMESLEALGGETWFRLGDGDVALHVERTRRLTAGESLESITDDLRRHLGVTARIVPMCNSPVPTLVNTPDDILPFQEYFVRLRCEPAVTGFQFEDIEAARPADGFMSALRSPSLEAVIICPSNPFISVDPILGIPGVREALLQCPAPVIAVSPVIGGEAVKGPTAKMMRELSLPVSASAVASHYGSLLDGFVLDETDATIAEELGIPCLVTRTLMTDDQRKRALAEDVLAFSRRLQVA